ncbi:MAG: hypothetical protein R3Y27_06160 [Clostridia bacterium]
MKKIISLALAMLMLLSTFCMLASASEVVDDVTYWTITYDYDNDTGETYVVSTKDGTYPGTPEDPTKASTETRDYTFMGWYDADTEMLYESRYDIPVAIKDTTYVAAYDDTYTGYSGEITTFWGLIESVFERLSDWLEQFYYFLVGTEGF